MGRTTWFSQKREQSNFFIVVVSFLFAAEMLPSIVSRRSEDDVKHVGMVYDNAAVEHQLSADRNEMLAPGTLTTRKTFMQVRLYWGVDFSRVLVIYTGGTIGMKHTREHGYIPVRSSLLTS